MAGYSAIADVGETLVELLREEMSALVDSSEVALASPDAVGQGDDVRLTLFLYRVTENAHLKNQPRQAVDATTDRDAPLEVDLHYVLTAHPSTTGSDETAKSKEQHTVLGRAMQVLADNAIVRGSALEGTLAGEDLYVSIEPDSAGELQNVWSTFQDEPFRPSVTYLVGPVAIESTEEESAARIVSRSMSSDPGGEGGDE